MKRALVAAIVVLGILAAGGCGLLLLAASDFSVLPTVEYIGGPSWSPDGTALVFHIEKDGKSELYRVNPDGSDLERLTSAGVYSRSPSWSPDGHRIAFSRAPDLLTYDLFVASADGTRPRRLHVGSDADHPTWAPDGRKIAFVVGSIDEVLGSAGRLGTVGADGRSERKLSSRAARNPAWSPTGKWIAFSRAENATYGVYVVRADGRGAERLVLREAADPTWSPDGRMLAVARGAGIFVIPPSGGRPRRLPIDAAGVGGLAWSPDGSSIAYATNEGIYVARIDGSGERRVAGLEDA